MAKARRIHSSRRRETATTYTFAENAAVLLPRAFEALWLVVAALVPLLFATPGVMVFVDVPKVGLLRSLTALMAVLWVFEWALLARRQSEYPEMTVWRRFKNWTKVNPARWVIVGATLFLAAVAISALASPSITLSVWGNNPGGDGFGLYTMASYYLLFIVIATHLKTERQLWRLLGVIAGAATLAAIYGVFQGFGADPFEQRIAGRVQSTFANPLFAGSFFAMALPLTLGMAFVAAQKYRLHIISAVWTLAIAIQFLAIMFTLSRGPWVAGTAGVLSILALVWVAAGSRALSRAGLILGVGIGLALAVVFFTDIERSGDGEGSSSSAVFGRAVSIQSEVTTGGLTGRVSIWKRSLAVMTDRPWFEPTQWWFTPTRHLVGYGPDMFLYALPLRYDSQSIDAVNANAHNFFVHVGVELGVLGLTTYIAMLGAIFYSGGLLLFRCRKAQAPMYGIIYAALLSVIVTRVVDQLTGVVRISDFTLFWIATAILVALPVVAQTTGDETVVTQKRRSESSGFANNPVVRWSFALAVLVLGVTLVWQKNVSYARASSLGADAVIAFQERDLPGSLSLMDEAIDAAPDVEWYYIARAQMMNAFGTIDLTDEIEIATQQYSLNKAALELNSLSHIARFATAASAAELARLGQGDKGAEAIELYTDLTRRLPGFEQAYNDLATTYLIEGRPEKALRALDGFVKFTGGREKPSADSLYVRGVAYQALDEVADAIASLEWYLETRLNNRYTESAENRLAELREVQEARSSRQ